MNSRLDSFKSAWRSGKSTSPELDYSYWWRLKNAFRLARFGRHRVLWFADNSGQKPGQDRPWRAGDRFEILDPKGKRVRVCRQIGIDQEFADDLNWAFRWTNLLLDQQPVE